MTDTRTPECWMCGESNVPLRRMHDGFHGPRIVLPEDTCEDCMPSTDDGPCFDDLPETPAPALPLGAGKGASFPPKLDAPTFRNHAEEIAWHREQVEQGK